MKLLSCNFYWSQIPTAIGYLWFEFLQTLIINVTLYSLANPLPYIDGLINAILLSLSKINFTYLDVIYKPYPKHSEWNKYVVLKVFETSTKDIYYPIRFFKVLGL